jgi:soluble lytic murein transglycosylase-like protein
LFTDEIQFWGDEIVKWSKKYGIDPNLTATVMQIESCGDPQAHSHAGASGLFQVMPYHFASGEDPFDPQTNASRGLAYLVQALAARGGDARLALASYNGGISGASRPESQWAAETQRYAYWGDGIYQDAVKGKKKSSRLDEWLNAGGASLCAQASSRLALDP